MELPGPSLKGERIVIGAHYDTAIGTPGANDNATGVAALLELSRLSAHNQFERTLEFVFFTNEEPPSFQTGEMGSLVYARTLRKDNARVVAMISLETIGSYSDARNSQHYPAGFAALYPDTGNFIAFVGDTSSRKLVRCVVESFRRSAKFPSEGIAAPANLPGIGWSDHWSFWQQGYPALMVTDTAPFRYPYYHRALDTPNKLDFERMARVTAGLRLVLSELASRSSCLE